MKTAKQLFSCKHLVCTLILYNIIIYYLKLKMREKDREKTRKRGILFIQKIPYRVKQVAVTGKPKKQSQQGVQKVLDCQVMARLTFLVMLRQNIYTLQVPQIRGHLRILQRVYIALQTLPYASTYINTKFLKEFPFKCTFSSQKVT